MTPASKLKVKVQTGITIVLGVFAIYLIATEPSGSEKIKWAYGIFGIIIGYWLK